MAGEKAGTEAANIEAKKREITNRFMVKCSLYFETSLIWKGNQFYERRQEVADKKMADFDFVRWHECRFRYDSQHGISNGFPFNDSEYDVVNSSVPTQQDEVSSKGQLRLRAFENRMTHCGETKSRTVQH